jgi:hypothetical protein
MYSYFYKLCREGKLIEIKELVHTTNSYIYIYTYIEFGFIQACVYKHIHVIRYLISLYRVCIIYDRIHTYAFSNVFNQLTTISDYLHDILAMNIVKYCLKHTLYPQYNNHGYSHMTLYLGQYKHTFYNHKHMLILL